MVIDKDHIGYCEVCGKRRYGSRKAAKAVARRMPDHQVPYRCPRQREYWHTGHLAKPIIHGIASKEDIYQRGAA